MELSPEAKQLLNQRIEEWNAILQARNNVRFTFSNSAGWRNAYSIFYPIEENTIEIQYSPTHRTHIVGYKFKQEVYITAALPSEEAALQCNDFFKRNTDLHHHQAVFQLQDWVVQERDLVSDNGEKRYSCDRFVSKGGRTSCVNDYNCRETDEIAGSLKGNPVVSPTTSTLHRCRLEETIQRPSLLDGALQFKIYDYPDDAAKSVEITFWLDIFFNHNQHSYSAETEISFLVLGISGYKKPAKTKLKKTLMPLLKSAVHVSRLLLEKELGTFPEDSEAFPDSAAELGQVFDSLWSRLAVDYY